METTADNSRSANRMSPTTDSAVVHGLTPTPTLAAVIDESFGGIGIAVPLKLATDGHELDEQELTIEYGGISCVGLVRHVAPLQSGCRLGLEWKAQALSRCLRDLIKIKTDVNKDLARILPGGLSMMWKLYEAGRWHFLLDSTDRLRRQVAACDVSTLSDAIEDFQAIVREADAAPADEASKTSAKSAVKTALNDLIRQCIAVIT